MKCIKCQTKLKGKQTKYCGRVCKNRYLNSWHNTAEKQKQKGITRKIELIKMLGNLQCNKCGYDKNLSCLSFHHKTSSEKKFSLDQRSCSMLGMKRLIEEAKKCEILCMNCHGELHHPECEIGGPSRI